MGEKKMTKYKLKDHVTDEMLVACGFEIGGSFTKWAVRSITDYPNADKEIYISLNGLAISALGHRYIQFNFTPYNKHLDITPFISDLIEKEYVEVVE